MKMLSRKEFMKGTASAAALTLLSRAGIPVWAAGEPAVDAGLIVPQLDVPPCEEEIAKYAQANAEVFRYGEQLLNTRTIEKTLSCPVHYYQNNGDKWCYNIMQTKGSTIHKEGCCLVSFAMIQRYMGGTADPGKVNQTLGNYACPFNYEKAAENFGYRVANKIMESVTQSYVKTFVTGAIGANRPVLIGMTYTGGTHFVMAYGFYNTDPWTVLIYDPDHGKNYTTLQQYYNQGYSVNRLVTYEK